jgi:putative transposase
VVIEDLGVRGMLRNHRLAEAFSDVGIGELRRQFEYKAALYGFRVVVADRFFSSSRRCGECGAANDALTLSDRTWQCSCGAFHYRDWNAARNLEKLAGSSPDNSMPVDGKALAQ